MVSSIGSLSDLLDSKGSCKVVIIFINKVVVSSWL